jgi:hypothetical protein
MLLLGLVVILTRLKEQAELTQTGLYKELLSVIKESAWICVLMGSYYLIRSSSNQHKKEKSPYHWTGLRATVIRIGCGYQLPFLYCSIGLHRLSGQWEKGTYP